MRSIRRAAQRGQTQTDTSESFHSFSFADFYDPNGMGVRSLRVANEHRVASNGALKEQKPSHMELFLIVVNGELSLKSSYQKDFPTLQSGEVLWLSTGAETTIQFSNASEVESLHFFEFWVFSDRQDYRPSSLNTKLSSNPSSLFNTIARGRGERDSEFPIRQDVRIDLAQLSPAQESTWATSPGRSSFVHVLSGEVVLDGDILNAGDAFTSIGGKGEPLKIVSLANSQVIAFDLA